MISVLTAFLATWDNARATLGTGTPVDGSRFDMGGRLEQFRDTVLGTAPGEQWTGSAAEAYTDRNQRLAGTIGRLAELDRRLGAEVGRRRDGGPARPRCGQTVGAVCRGHRAAERGG
ncbi:hypothetical protein C1S82_17425 [Mycolicibacterium cosmeticum]|uniref:EspA/EspE family type VII secretion system effector n=1 Tax=Mycolicibacterium cosmeticum TaxID=258533 RepID=UPI0006869E3A|nr:EspA/EspE family type VII secretion system effector [Mycolicibacterium cosmeticum]TLH72604.1 hypothetical protein C1S82_17425 [Mycolicibacterium cosmeticum]